ncbi:MAG: hypothetical protein ACE5JX_03025 [Acidobacteriota bacterium]
MKVVDRMRDLCRGLLAAGLTALILFTSNALARPGPSGWPDQTQTYHYRLKGKVRLLIFWVGKDDVGGGHISLRRLCKEQTVSCSEQVEVLFGSKPERVPGKINRWGYGSEQAEWEDFSGHGRALRKSVFRGFMRSSKEDSLKQVRSNDNQEKSKKLFSYDSTESTVLPDRAFSDKRIFSTAEEFDYRDTDRLQSVFQLQEQSGVLPDKHKEIHNEKALYAAPYGFLTAVHELVRRVSAAYQSGSRKWTRKRESLIYMFNAEPYRLSVRDIDYHKKFRVRMKSADKHKDLKLPVRHIAEVDFRVEKLGKGGHHDFSIWFPLEGPFQAVPLRIEDKPRWWLRLELNVEPRGELETWLKEQASPPQRSVGKRPSDAARRTSDTGS